MKLSVCIIRTQSVYRNALKNFFGSSSSHNLHSHASSSSFIAEKRDDDGSPKKDASNLSLYRRISPVGDPDISIVPVLDQWVREGRKVDKDNLVLLIKTLKGYKRFKHALEISEWMTDKRYMPLSMSDIVHRLQLIYKVCGLEKAEKYYNNLSKVFKGYEVEVALMNCYAKERSVGKAEAQMQKLRDSQCSMTAMPYSILMNLYYEVRSWEKMDTLSNEMEEKGVYGDKYTFTPRLNAYAATSDVEGLTRTMARMESDPNVDMDCLTYIVAAKAFLKSGLTDEVLEILKKVEKLATTSKGKYKTLNAMLRMYATLGKKDEVYRIWDLFRKEKMYNGGYRSMISSLLILDDMEGAEKIFEEWDSKGLSYDFRLPDCLIDAYVKKGQLEKAEVLLNDGIEKEGNPTFKTWYCLTGGYIEDNQVLKGVEALKNAALSCRCAPYQLPIKDKLVICMEYLERKREMEEVEEFVNSLEMEGIFSSTVCERLLSFIKGENLES